MKRRFAYLRFFKGEKLDEVTVECWNELDFLQTINNWNRQSLTLSTGNYIYVAQGPV